MKRFHLLLALGFLLSSASLSFATTSPHHAVTFTATVYTSSTTSSATAVTHATHVTNATILNSLVTSGSVTGVQATDLDIVLGTNTEIDVINKHTLTPLYTLAHTGTASSTTSTIVSGSVAGKLSIRITVEDYEIMLPQIAVLRTGALISGALLHLSQVENLSFSFNGGNGNSIGNQQIIGRIHTKPKVYTY